MPCCPYRLIRVQGYGEGGNPRSSQRLAGQLGPALITRRAGTLILTPIVNSQPGETWSLIALGSREASYQNILCRNVYLKQVRSAILKISVDFIGGRVFQYTRKELRFIIPPDLHTYIHSFNDMSAL